MNFLNVGINFLQQAVGESATLMLVSITCSLSALFLIWAVALWFMPSAKLVSRWKFLVFNSNFYVSFAALSVVRPDNLIGFTSFGYFLLCLAAWWPLIAFVVASAMAPDEGDINTFSG
jgi:hypothetical protein